MKQNKDINLFGDYMNREKIKKFIKEIRKKSGLTQEKFAEKYGVTYQSVSKWESGKSIPNIVILRQMCEEYKQDFGYLLNDSDHQKKQWPFFKIAIVIIIVMGICLLLFLSKNNSDFKFKKLSTICENFDLDGSIAYNGSKTSIYISNISYYDTTDEKEYKEIECSLYEIDDETKTKISSFEYKGEETISLAGFLKKVDFNIEHHSTACKMYQENGMNLEIRATNTSNQTIFYNIPLKLEENCNEYDLN